MPGFYDKLKKALPWLRNKMGTAEHVWRAAEFYNAKPEATLTKDRRQGTSNTSSILRKREMEVITQ